jgi:hypothetical protein
MRIDKGYGAGTSSEIPEPVKGTKMTEPMLYAVNSPSSLTNFHRVW